MSGWIGALAHAWWRWIEPMSVQVALLGLVVALADRWIARRAWPQMGTMLWLVVLFKLVIPPTVSSPVSIARLGLGVEAAPAAPSSAGWVTTLFAVWALGLLSFALLAVRRCLAQRRWLNGPRLFVDEALRSRSRRIARQLGLARAPRVRVLPGAATPAVVGFLRPVVVLPPELARGTGPRLDHVLLHEFAHIRRRDSLASLAVLLVQLCYWFHPLVWLACRRLAAWREICCDQAVARALGSSSHYRRTLLDLARPWLQGPARGLGFLHPESQLLARLAWLDRPLSQYRRLQGAATASLLAVLLLCCVPLARPTPAPARAALPALEDLEGCMQMRFAVLARLAQRAPPPVPDRHP